jgi:hypothetical protein
VGSAEHGNSKKVQCGGTVQAPGAIVPASQSINPKTLGTIVSNRNSGSQTRLGDEAAPVKTFVENQGNRVTIL